MFLCVCVVPDGFLHLMLTNVLFSSVITWTSWRWDFWDTCYTSLLFGFVWKGKHFVSIAAVLSMFDDYNPIFYLTLQEYLIGFQNISHLQFGNNFFGVIFFKDDYKKASSQCLQVCSITLFSFSWGRLAVLGLPSNMLDAYRRTCFFTRFLGLLVTSGGIS